MDLKTQILQQAIQTLAPLAVGVLVSAATWALHKLAGWLDAKGKESKLAAALAVLPHAAEAVWVDVQRALEPDLRAALADGKLDPAELAALREEAIQVLKLSLPKHGLAALGQGSGALLDLMLGRVVDLAQARLASPK